MFHFPNTGENLSRLNYLSRFLKRVLIYKTCCNLGPELSHAKRNLTVSRKPPVILLVRFIASPLLFSFLVNFVLRGKCPKTDFFGPYFPEFEQKTSYLATFHAVLSPIRPDSSIVWR